MLCYDEAAHALGTFAGDRNFAAAFAMDVAHEISYHAEEAELLRTVPRDYLAAWAAGVGLADAPPDMETIRALRTGIAACTVDTQLSIAPLALEWVQQLLGGTHVDIARVAAARALCDLRPPQS
jgi:hypothetical protein